MILELTADDVGYVCMPLFHSNALMVGWAPAIVYGASIGLAPRFSASGWLPDVRRYRSTWWNYTGKPLAYILATPERPDDADNPLRVAYGNEGSQALVAEFGRRFAVNVIDAYGATEGGVAVDRDCEPRPGALGKTKEGVIVVDDDGVERPRAKFDGRRPPAQRRGVRGRDRQHHRARPVRGLLQQRRGHVAHDAQGAGTGAATWATSTTTTTSTSPAAPPSGCASTARTSRSAPSRRRWPGITTRWRQRCTACPTSRPATR